MILRIYNQIPAILAAL